MSITEAITLSLFSILFRSKESSEHGDEAHPSKKVEPAPPPKENAWSRRPRIEPSVSQSTCVIISIHYPFFSP